MSDLDKSLRALITAHGLININVVAHDDNFGVALQWDGGPFNGRGCVFTDIEAQEHRARQRLFAELRFLYIV